MEKNNKVIIIFVVILVIALIGGVTFSYWRWVTNNSQETNFNVSVAGATMTIVGDSITTVGMYPTDDCDGESALIGDIATVTVENNTNSLMQADLKIRVTLTKSQDSLNESNREYLKWAVVEMNSSTAIGADNECLTSSIAAGTFADVSSSNTDIDTGIRFIAGANTTTIKYYKLYIWLDSTYTYTNSGSTISDPMQDLTISAKWSPASTLSQQY